MEPEFGARSRGRARSRGSRDLRLSFISVVVALAMINASYFGMVLDHYKPHNNQGLSSQLLRSKTPHNNKKRVALIVAGTLQRFLFGSMVEKVIGPLTASGIEGAWFCWIVCRLLTCSQPFRF